MKIFRFLIFFFSLIFLNLSWAKPAIVPQPTTCIASAFTTLGDQYWKTVRLKLTNQCNQAIDFQNASINFLTRTSLNTIFWGNFSPLAYPDNLLMITSQAQAGNYLASLFLHFPNTTWANSKLPPQASFTIEYGTSNDTHIDGSLKVFLDSPTTNTGTINLINATAKPANVSQNNVTMHVTSNGQSISDILLPWNGTQSVPGLAPGNYAITSDNVTDSTGVVYQGTANPATVAVLADQTVNSTISYTAVMTNTGKIALQLQSLPTELTGYTSKPTVLVKKSDSSSSTSTPLNWGNSTTVSQLTEGASYTFSTPVIDFNGYQCTPTFSPNSVIANGTNVPISQLTYTCAQVAQSRVTINVNGAPTSLASLNVKLTPNDGSAVVQQVVPLSQGSGCINLMLPTGTIYAVSADEVSGYSITFNPANLTASPNAVETITLSTGTPISIHGQLKVCGTQLCDKANTPIQLKGMSSHGLQWYGLNKCLTNASISALATDFKASVIRLSLYVQEGGYETDPVGYTNQMNQLINLATQKGLYVLVDWHMLDPGDPNYNLDRAKKFFTDVINANKDKTNLIYEIANEPNGVTWATIRNYANALIPVIRALDPNAVIVVGTPGWSSLGISDGKNSQEIINQPINFPNVMYTFHFYAKSHQQEYLNELDKASNSLPIFVTEWGSQEYTGDGANDFTMSDNYIQLMSRKKISWTNWNFSDDFRSGAIWKTSTCSAGPWTDAQLKPAGVYVKDKIKN